MEERQYFVGVDGGGSKTAAVVVDDELATLGEATAGPSNFLRVGMDEAVGELRRAITEALARTAVSLSDVAFTYIGVAGADHPSHRASLVAAMRDYFPAGNFAIDSDARVALTAAIGHGAGIVVISGTGSVAYGRNDEGEEARAGGWGPTLGDEGSGYSIARRGLSAIVRAYDGRNEPTLITDLLCRHHGMCDPSELPYFVYAPSTHANDIATYCTIVIEAAKSGDPIAMKILHDEGEELGEAVVAVARQLHLLDREFPVAWVGGAFRGGELLLAPLRERIASEAPGARLQPPLEAPAQGAARMAIESARRGRVRVG